MEEEVCIAQFEGFVVNGKEDKIYRSKKVLYELKQVPRVWYFKIDSYFQENGFERSNYEPTLYIKSEGEDFLVVCFYVDDMIYIGSNEFLLLNLKIA